MVKKEELMIEDYVLVSGTPLRLDVAKKLINNRVKN